MTKFVLPATKGFLKATLADFGLLGSLTGNPPLPLRWPLWEESSLSGLSLGGGVGASLGLTTLTDLEGGALDGLGGGGVELMGLGGGEDVGGVGLIGLISESGR